uniref:hypothetical protein n=1 Tax=Taibaiella koreensis TaxID=1268548 RepID=UPI0013C3393D|nr:hypothetical protein [Taibaiella koreensis]
MINKAIIVLELDFFKEIDGLEEQSEAGKARKDQERDKHKGDLNAGTVELAYINGIKAAWDAGHDVLSFMNITGSDHATQPVHEDVLYGGTHQLVAFVVKAVHQLHAFTDHEEVVLIYQMPGMPGENGDELKGIFAGYNRSNFFSDFGDFGSDKIGGFKMIHCIRYCYVQDIPNPVPKGRNSLQ